MPHLRVVSLADIVAPSLAAPCVDPDAVGLRPDGDGRELLCEQGEGPLERERRPQPRASAVRALATSVFAPYDRSAALLFYGAIGLVAMHAFETFGAMIVLEQGFPDAFYGATKSLAIVDRNPKVQTGPSWFKLAISVSTTPYAAQ